MYSDNHNPENVPEEYYECSRNAERKRDFWHGKRWWKQQFRPDRTSWKRSGLTVESVEEMAGWGRGKHVVGGISASKGSEARKQRVLARPVDE